MYISKIYARINESDIILESLCMKGVSHMTTIREIATKAGFSPATVSRLLNNDPTFSVSEVTRKKILTVARNLNYYQQNKQSGTQYEIAVIFSVQPRKELEDIYYTNLRESIMNAGKIANMVLKFYREVDDISPRTNGYIAIGYFNDSQIKQLSRLTSNGIFVDSNPNPRLFNSVQPNLEAMTQQAIELFRKKGIDKIGFVGGRYWNTKTNQLNEQIDDARKKYFESHMRELNIYDAEKVFIGDTFSVESGYQMGHQIFMNSNGKKELPQALLIASDALAVGVLQAFNEERVIVPDDVEIISINDIELAKYVAPPLTTFRINVNELGRVAINTLRDTILFPDHSKQMILLNCELIYRKSFTQP